MNAYQLIVQPPAPAEFLRLRRAVGWQVPTSEAAARALASDRFTVSIRRGDVCVGCGRVLGDGALVFYVQDVMVLPDHQGLGLGTLMMDRLMAHIHAKAEAGAFVALFSAPSMVSWYTRYGFQPRPNHTQGPGMVFFKS